MLPVPGQPLRQIELGEGWDLIQRAAQPTVSAGWTSGLDLSFAHTRVSQW